MNKPYVGEAAIFVFYAFSFVRGHLTTRLIDLTHVISQDTVFWPGNPEYNFTILHRNLTPPGFWFENNYLATAEHGGTHFDAPAHFFKGGWRSQQIPLERLVGPGCIIDVRRKASADPDYRVTVQDLKDWENKFGKIPHGAVVVMNSDWDKKYPNKTLTFGSDDPTDQTTFHFPGFHEEAADWLVRYRNIHVIGVDTPSLDYGQSRTAPVHVIVSGVNILGLENVANLNKLPQAGSTIFVGAIKLFDGSGGPARVFATVTEAETCEDKVLCKLYSQAICTDPAYYEWRQNNCPKYCGMCTTETPQGVGKMIDSDGSPPCSDAIDNCADYGIHLCDDVKFYNWVNENCMAHCNRCSNVCEDKVTNCQDYGDDLCTNLQYYNWVQMHCRKYCARCS